MVAEILKFRPLLRHMLSLVIIWCRSPIDGDCLRLIIMMISGVTYTRNMFCALAKNLSDLFFVRNQSARRLKYPSANLTFLMSCNSYNLPPLS